MSAPDGSTPDSGRYVFLMRLSRPASLEVGALGRFRFPAGWYAYVGSAQKAMRKRIERHCARDKRKRWHIDYLSTAPGAEPIGAALWPVAAVEECELNRRVGKQLGGTTPVPGFGASDCSEGCPAHLWSCGAAVSLLEIAGVHPGAQMVLAGRRP